MPGGLVRVNSAGNGRGAPYDPYSLTFADSLSRVAGNHFMKVGGDVRLIRMSTDQLGGITYTLRQPRPAFLANTPTHDSVLRRPERAEPVPQRRDGPEAHRAGVLRRLRAGRVARAAEPHAELRPPLRLLRAAAARPTTGSSSSTSTPGTIDPDTTPLYKSKKNNFQPRVSATYSPTSKTVFRGGFGIFVGPGQTEDQIQPVEAERISTTLTSGALPRLSGRPGAGSRRTSSTTRTTGRTSRAPTPNEYTLPEKVYQYTASVQQELAGSMAATVAYVGSQGRNLFLRSIANRTIGVQSNGAAAATQIREFDIVTRNADGTHRDASSARTPKSTTRPAAATTATTRCSSSLTRRSAARPDDERAVHARLQQGQHRRVERSDDRRQQRAGASPTSTTTTATTTSTSATRST